MLDVIKCIYFIFLQKHNECMAKKGTITSVKGECDLSEAIKIQEEIFGIDDIATFLQEDNEIVEGF